MHHSTIWDDINTAVHNAITQELYLLDEGDLTERSDANLSNLPVVGAEQPTTALLLRRYQTQLQNELCVGKQPRTAFDDLESELRELTRAVVVTLATSERISLETAVLVALILRTRGLTAFCAQPSLTPHI